MTWNETDHPRRNDGTPGATQFASKTNSPSPVSLKPATAARPVDISGLTETPRTVTPEEHGIKGLGNLEVSREGNLLRMAMHLPEGTRLPQDLSEWDTGSRTVDATNEMESAIEDHLGIRAGDDDTLTIKDGRPVFTHYESFGAGGEIDPEDLESWSGDFTALADPEVQSSLAEDIVERYDNG